MVIKQGLGDYNSTFNISSMAEVISNCEVIENIVNGKKALLVDTQSIESSYAEEFTEDVENLVIIEPTDNDSSIYIKDVFMVVNGNIGEVEIDFDDDKKIARLYSSQFNRAGFTNLTLKGDNGSSVKITADAQDNKLYVVINYIEVKN